MCSFAQQAGRDSRELKGVQAIIRLREELKAREETGNKCVADAKGRLASTNERAAAMLDNLFEQEVNTMFAKFFG